MATQSASVDDQFSSMSGSDRGDDAASLLVHGSAVRLFGYGILLLGPPTSGKSDLALCLIDVGAVLIADDQVSLTRRDDHLHARAPERLAGLLALRGMGIMRLPCAEGGLDIAVDLVPSSMTTDPLPAQATASWLGVTLPKLALDPLKPSAVARIKMFLQTERVV